MTAIHGSKFDVWDEMSAIVSQRNGSYLSQKKTHFIISSRNNQGHQARSNPYQVPKHQVPVGPNFGRFIDDETEIEFIQSRVKKLPNVTKDLDSENGIPNLPKIEKKLSFTPTILIQNTNADYQILDLGLTIILDQCLKNVGIWIPETILEEDIKVIVEILLCLFVLIWASRSAIL